MNQTPNYQLSQWAASDPIQRTDFNADNAKIDAALGALQTAVSAKAEVIFGTYTGDGAAEREIVLGRKLKALFVISRDGETSRDGFRFGGLAFQNTPALFDNYPLLTLTDTGFIVYYHHTASARASATNNNSFTFHYIAFV